MPRYFVKLLRPYQQRKTKQRTAPTSKARAAKTKACFQITGMIFRMPNMIASHETALPLRHKGAKKIKIELK